jgi:hypothetical protein
MLAVGGKLKPNSVLAKFLGCADGQMTKMLMVIKDGRSKIESFAVV